MSLSVSIITPAYNAQETIADAINSVLAQTHPYWEMIVVDDGSTDSTGDVIREFVERDSRIRTIFQPQSGRASARNAGLTLARNEWLLFLDADDWISPFHLERLTAEILSNPELDAVHCGYARVAKDGTQVVYNYSPPTGDLFPVLAKRAIFSFNACIVRKSIVDAVGRFDVSLTRSTDWDLWQRVARTGARFGGVREVLAFYRMNPRGGTLDAPEMLNAGLRILKRGHAPDPRVPSPHPDHASGFPPEEIPKQEFYLLAWCAGILLGEGKDARPLLNQIQNDHFSELDSDAIAQCIFDAAPLARCQPPERWEELGPQILGRTNEFLLALEQQSKTVGLASLASEKLRKMILYHSPSWQPIIEQYDKNIESQRKTIEELEQANVQLENKVSEHQRQYEELQRTMKQNEERQRRHEELQQIMKQNEERHRHSEELQRIIKQNRERERIFRQFQKQFWIRSGIRLGVLKPPDQIRLRSTIGQLKHLTSTRRFSYSIGVIVILLSCLEGIFYSMNWNLTVRNVSGITLAITNLIFAIALMIKPHIRFLIGLMFFYCAQLGNLILQFLPNGSLNPRLLHLGIVFINAVILLSVVLVVLKIFLTSKGRTLDLANSSHKHQ